MARPTRRAQSDEAEAAACRAFRALSMASRVVVPLLPPSPSERVAPCAQQWLSAGPPLSAQLRLLGVLFRLSRAGAALGVGAAGGALPLMREVGVARRASSRRLQRRRRKARQGRQAPPRLRRGRRRAGFKSLAPGLLPGGLLGLGRLGLFLGLLLPPAPIDPAPSCRQWRAPPGASNAKSPQSVLLSSLCLRTDENPFSPRSHVLRRTARGPPWSMAVRGQAAGLQPSTRPLSGRRRDRALQEGFGTGNCPSPCCGSRDRSAYLS